MRKRAMQRGMAALAVVATGAVLGGCTEKTPCDEGQVLRDGYCWAVDAAAPPPAPADGGAISEAGAASAFGQTCVASTECAAPAVYCAIQPEQTSGFCTAFGCDVDPSICPAGWSCINLASYGLAAHMCIPGA